MRRWIEMLESCVNSAPARQEDLAARVALALLQAGTPGDERSVVDSPVPALRLRPEQVAFMQYADARSRFPAHGVGNSDHKRGEDRGASKGRGARQATTRIPAADGRVAVASAWMALMG